MFYLKTPAGEGLRSVSCFEKAKNSLPLRGKERFAKPRQQKIRMVNRCRAGKIKSPLKLVLKHLLFTF
jgi:hypothetical protein